MLTLVCSKYKVFDMKPLPEKIFIEEFKTEQGPMLVCATKKGVCLLEFTDRKNLQNEFQDLCKRLAAEIVSGSNSHSDLAKKEVQLYLSGDLQNFSVELDTPGTDFQQRVWQTLRQIPYGKTWSYAEQAEKMMSPRAVRAVAAANGMNRIALMIPCHRVIGSDGSLTGYAAGLPRKKWLLEMEKAHC